MSLKIGFFTDSYLPYTSGVVRSIETFSEGLKAQGHEVFIFAPDYANNQNQLEEDRVFRFPSIYAPTYRDFALAVPFSTRLRPTLDKIDLDIIHIHSPFLLGSVGAHSAKKLNIPLVFTFHTLYDKYAFYLPLGHNFAQKITKKYCTDFCNHCDSVIVPTRIVGEQLREWGVKTAIKALPTGIDIDSFRTEEKNWLYRQYKIDPDERLLISVSRLGKEKNVSFVLKSFKNINAAFPNTRLILVGDGPDKDALVNLAGQLEISEKVLFTGKLPKEDVIKAYNSAHLFVFASITETQGLVVGEAKATGLPAVAVNAFGISEMIEDSVDGFLTGLDIDEFTNKVNLLLGNEDLRLAMSQNALKNSHAISAENCTQKLIRHYFEIIEKHNKDDKIPNLS